VPFAEYFLVKKTRKYSLRHSLIHSVAGVERKTALPHVMSSMNSCAKCGACTVVCPVYRVTGQEGHTARGKLHLALLCDLPGKGVVFEDIFSKCLLCGACTSVCPRDIDVCRQVVQSRAAFPAISGAHGYEKYLARKVLSHPEILAPMRILGRVGARLLLKYLPEDSGLRLRLALFQQDTEAVPADENFPAVPSGLDLKEGLICFPGCSARYLFPEILSSCDSLVAGLGQALSIPAGLSCCGLAAFAAGDRQEAEKCARNNIIVLEQSSGPVLVSCASCYAHLCRYGDLFADDPVWRNKAEGVKARLVEISCFLDSQPASGVIPAGTASSVTGEKKVRVFYHDPCHLRHGLIGTKIIAEPRRVLARNPQLELLELPDGPQCCGQGGLFHVSAPEISAVIRDTLAAKVLALAPEVITSTCSGCLMQWRVAVEVAGAGNRVRVLHLAELLAESAIERVNGTGP
jgi:glycolate oxidase iron-sulfur subunit